ncbi:MAG TPA: pitrilysin family protein [Cyclobacteriaceae bacterium]|nr:pitrilysin family protein [Cyclobacteriaceae bacterium]
MKKIIFILLVGFICINGYSQVDRTKAPAPSPAREIKIGEYQTFTLKNGLQVFVVENHKLPRIQFSLELRNDPILEGNKAGYVSIAGDLIGTGTTKRTKAQLDEEVDFIGAALNTSSNGIYASSLSKHSNKLLELMTDVLFNPSFLPEELEKIRTQTLSGLAAQKDDPEAIASNVRSVLVYGKGHPYGEIEKEETVKAITIDDCKNYYNTYFKPNNAYLAIVGDVDLKTAKSLVEKYFGKWQKGEVKNPTYKMPTPPSKTFVALVDRPASVQSVINIAYPIDLKPGSPDAIKIGVANNILGGSGLSSRLNKNLREDKAFTYGAYSSVTSDKLVGSFDAEGSVRNEVTDSAVFEFLHELKTLSTEHITDEELASAKAYLSGSFGRSLERPQTVANFALNTARYNLPKDYYANYVKNVAAVTKEEVLAVSQKYVLPDHAYILVVGKGSEIADKLGKFGEVKYYDMYGENYTPSKAAALPPGLTAEKVIGNYINALGGVEKIRAIKTVKASSKASVPGAELVINSAQKAPNKAVVEIAANGTVFQKVVSDGQDISITQMGQKAPMDDATKEETIFDAYIVPELFFKEKGVKVNLVSVEKVDGKDAFMLEYVYPSGNKASVYFDAGSSLKVQTMRTMDTPQGKATQTISYQDYKEVNGVKFPYTVVQSFGPQNLKAEVTSLEVNVPLEDALFTVEK